MVTRKTKHRIAQAKYRKGNKEKCITATKLWRKNNPAKISAYSSNYYKENKLSSQIKNRQWSASNRLRRKHLNLKRRYGITIEEYDKMLKLQKERCAICGQKMVGSKNCNVDHDHKTGKVRGLLCFRCNTTLGLAKDSIVILKQSIKYLRA